jgi:tetratricopeptide (TPR) repeat protein
MREWARLYAAPQTARGGYLLWRRRIRFAALLCLVVSLMALAEGTARPQRGRQSSASGRSAYVVPAPSKSVEIGNFYLRRKKYQGALSRFEEAIHSDPYYAPAYLGLGKVYEKLGKDDQALDAYEKYLDLLPSDKDAEDAKSAHRAIDRLRKMEAGSR